MTPKGVKTLKWIPVKTPPCRLKSAELPPAQQADICTWARLVWAQGGSVSVITDGSYKERAHLEADGRLHWASSAGCAWVVGETATGNAEAESTWRLVRSHGVHNRTAGERALFHKLSVYGSKREDFNPGEVGFDLNNQHTPSP